MGQAGALERFLADLFWLESLFQLRAGVDPNLLPAFTRTSMLLVCGLEGLLFTGLLAARKLSFPHWGGPGLHRRLLEEFALRPLFFLGRMLFWGLLLFSLYKMIRLVGGVFTNWDAVVS